MPILWSIANSFCRVIMLVDTELMKLTIPIRPIITLKAPPIVIIRDVMLLKD